MQNRETRMPSCVLSSPFSPLFWGERGRNPVAQFRTVEHARFQQGSRGVQVALLFSVIPTPLPQKQKVVCNVSCLLKLLI